MPQVFDLEIALLSFDSIAASERLGREGQVHHQEAEIGARPQ
jgi:hypothetical protein